MQPDENNNEDDQDLMMMMSDAASLNESPNSWRRLFEYTSESSNSTSLPRDVTHLTVHPNVNIIGRGSFQACNQLVQVTLVGEDASSHLKVIGDSAFANCKLLETISIPSSVETIRDDCFRNCRSLRHVELSSKGLVSIGDECFYECFALESIQIPFTVETIQDGAFCRCTGLTRVEFSEAAGGGSKLTEMGADVFMHCKKLTDIAIPSSLSSLEDGTFSVVLHLPMFY